MTTQLVQHERHAVVTQILQRIQREHPLRATRVAGDEHQFVIGRAVRGHLQEVFDVRRLPVLVHAKQGHIQTVARVLEIVRIAAEERDASFRGPHEPHVRVLLVAVQVILGTTVERDDVTPQAGLIERLLFDLAITARRARNASAADMSAVTAALTRSVTSRIDTS